MTHMSLQDFNEMVSVSSDPASDRQTQMSKLDTDVNLSNECADCSTECMLDHIQTCHRNAFNTGHLSIQEAQLSKANLSNDLLCSIWDAKCCLADKLDNLNCPFHDWISCGLHSGNRNSPCVKTMQQPLKLGIKNRTDSFLLPGLVSVLVHVRLCAILVSFCSVLGHQCMGSTNSSMLNTKLPRKSSFDCLGTQFQFADQINSF